MIFGESSALLNGTATSTTDDTWLFSYIAWPRSDNYTLSYIGNFPHPSLQFHWWKPMPLLEKGKSTRLAALQHRPPARAVSSELWPPRVVEVEDVHRLSHAAAVGKPRRAPRPRVRQSGTHADSMRRGRRSQPMRLTSQGISK